MSNGNVSASFFENGTTTQFEYCYQMYPEVLKLKAEKRSKKPQELIRLDQWYQNELPKLIKARGKDAHMVYDELVQTMKWKQSRGKFYPQLSYLVKVNTPRAVVQETKKAFRKLPNLEQAITALSNLKGVGTTMASALLAAAAPDSAPFMADECLMAIPEIEGIDYTTKEYLNFVNHIQSTVERLNAEVGGETPHWSPHRVELALWSHYVANDLSPEMLDDMPAPGAAASVNAVAGTASLSTNGSLGKSSKVLDGDDTNDGVAVDLDDESLGAGGRNTATESETENENTNPAALTGDAKINSNSNSNSNAGAVGALQDGDSNFVSNDSTSQDPIIDDNDGTTQTTATSSTEDGEPMTLGIGIGIGIGLGGGGTPLASDSESNLEAPPKANSLISLNQPAQPTSQAHSQQPHNNNKQITNNGQAASPASEAAAAAAEAESVKPAGKTGAAAANGNGNGNGVLGDGEDEDEEEDELDEEDENENEAELEAEESNSSNGIVRGSKLQQLQVQATNKVVATEPAAVAPAGDDGAPAIGQKRSALHCELELNNASGVGEKSPELKKLRSE
ncbi:hypothetical protein KR026_001042 [Drosophila bipectinata]|nr:hypothetical protein KR026_001042 [Drosophila bipectinata]